MRKVTGEEITIKELKNSVFGYEDDYDFSEMVQLIECHDTMYTTDEEGTTIIRFPKNPYDEEIFAGHCSRDKGLTVYDFITNYWGLDDYNLEEFTFYFAE